jgi:hypothetical protein
LRRPVLDPEPRHALELARVQGNELCAAPARLSGDQRIVGVESDRLAARVKKSTDFAGLASVLDIESGLVESGREEDLKRASLPGACFWRSHIRVRT